MRSRPDSRPTRGSGSDRLAPGVRQTVLERDLRRCVRCGGPASEIHHRRTKSVHDDHTHCPCNTIAMCGWGNTNGCHGWAHGNPEAARESGLIVSRFNATPFAMHVDTFRGKAWLDCHGHILL